jgi:DNA-binding GntR family transcriptional regulator
MPIDPIRLPGKQSRADELYAWLHEAIVSGQLRPHERLVETTLAELASVSRTPIREALRRLAGDGFVTERDSGGLEVCGFSLDELADLCAVRETLEGMVTGLAATSRSEMELATLRAMVQDEERLQDQTNDNLEERVALNHAFHEILWRASRNRYLADELKHLRGLIERLQHTTLRYPDRVEEAHQEHIAIIQALEDRDVARAEQLGRQHFRNAMARRLANPRVGVGVGE